MKNEFIAELSGTFIFLFLGMGCVAGLKVGGASYGQWEISTIWGSAVALGVYTTGSISGGHLNPAVTLALALFRGFPKRKILPYTVAQFLGAFLAAAAVYLLYYNLLTVRDLNAAGIFTTFPHKGVTFYHAFVIEAFITAVLIFAIFSLTDEENTMLENVSIPLVIGLVVTILGSSFGPLTGFAMNAARDLGPRLFLYIMGWGDEIFTGGLVLPYYLVPLIAPAVGAIIGAFIYQFFIKTLFLKKSSS